MEEWRTMPFLSMMQVALQETPTSPSSQRQPQALEISLLRSETRGRSMGPSPPSLRALRVYSMCENLESTETAMSSQPISRNSLTLLLKAMISVGQTKVKSKGQKKSTTYLPWQDLMSTSTKSPLYQAGATKAGAGFLMRDISKTQLYEDPSPTIQPTKETLEFAFSPPQLHCTTQIRHSTGTPKNRFVSSFHQPAIFNQAYYLYSAYMIIGHVSRCRYKFILMLEERGGLINGQQVVLNWGNWRGC